MWGQKNNEVAGIDELKYIEKLNLPIIGANSNFLSMTKLDFKKLAQENNILVPNYFVFNNESNIEKDLNKLNLNYPLIIKPIIGCGSLHMNENSVCNNISELKLQIEILSKKITCEILIEEFIIGKEATIIVIENKYDIISAPPIIYEFSNNIQKTKQFLYYENKFKSINNKNFTYKINNEDEELIKNIKKIGCNSYKILDVMGSGYSRIDMRIDDKNNIYVLEINPMPDLFYKNNEIDSVIHEHFDGGHEKIMDYIIESKFYQIKNLVIKNNYDKFSNEYEEGYFKTNMPKILENISKIYNFNGSVLDLGCGTGVFGRFLIKNNDDIKITGIDISPKMAEKAYEYNELYIGPIQLMINNFHSFDHIISSGALYFLDSDSFKEVIYKIFKIANISITIGVEDIPEIYNKKLISMGYENMNSYNNINIIENFELPLNWNLINKERMFMWSSPRTGDDIYGFFYRFEKEDIISDLNIGNIS
jgi:SAM-dependent methyltransferase